MVFEIHLGRRGRGFGVAVLTLFALASTCNAAPPADDKPAQSSQAFRLEQGEFRWIPFTVHQLPTRVDVTFRVVEGGPTVRTELLPMADFRAFLHHREHDTLALAPAAKQGEFRRMVDERGQYVVVVANADKAPAASVEMEIRIDSDPKGDTTAQVLPQERRLTVILASFAFFFVTVIWSGTRLLKAMKGS